MKLVTLTVLSLVLVAGCASTPLEKRKASIVDCTKTFMEYDANITEASDACINIYRKDRTAYVPRSIRQADSQTDNASNSSKSK